LPERGWGGTWAADLAVRIVVPSFMTVPLLLDHFEPDLHASS